MPGALLLANPADATAASDAAGPAAADVLARVAEFGTAFRDADVDRLSEMLGPQYAHTNTGGGNVVTTDQWLAYVRTRREELRSGVLKLTKYENRDVEPRIHGTVAIVTGVNSSAGTRNGVPFARELRFTQVWLLRAAKWQRIAFHDTEIVP